MQNLNNYFYTVENLKKQENINIFSIIAPILKLASFCLFIWALFGRYYIIAVSVALFVFSICLNQINWLAMFEYKYSCIDDKLIVEKIYQKNKHKLIANISIDDIIGIEFVEDVFEIDKELHLIAFPNKILQSVMIIKLNKNTLNSILTKKGFSCIVITGDKYMYSILKRQING